MGLVVGSEAFRWLSEAEWNLETAQILHREKRFNASTFYAYQSAEKAVKALLYHVNEAPWSYSIRVLLERFSRRPVVGIRDLKPSF